MSLRLKLLLAASLLLVVPLTGYRFVLAMETFLRDGQLEAAADAARTFARVLESRPELLVSPVAVADTGPVLYVHPLSRAPDIDGYRADWGELVLPGQTPGVRAARHRDSLYLLAVVHPAPRPARMRLVLEDAPDFARAWLIDAAVPGESAVLEVPPAEGAVAPAHADARVRAGAQPTPNGSVFEIRMPLALAAPRLRLEVLGRDGGVTRIPDSGTFMLLQSPAGLSRLLDSLASVQGRRLRVTDRQGRVLAQAGSLERSDAASDLTTLLDRLLQTEDDDLMSLAPGTLILDGPELRSALGGSPAARLRRGDDAGARVVSAAHPLSVGGRTTAALLLEESTSPIDALARRALEELALTAGGAFLVASALLLTIAGRAAARLRTLRDHAARSIDEAGRVMTAFEPPAGRDEIADLGRSFAAAVTRLHGYQNYLEQLARRLSHELRTPIAVIRSSLDNLAMRPDARARDDTVLLERAQEGVARLDGLVRRMSEAARLEHAMADSDRVPIDLAALLASAVAAYAQLDPQRTLQSRIEADPAPVLGSPELLLQALDKLVGNARDFASPGTQPCVTLERRGATLRLAVENDGPPLPPGDRDRLFDSMVSVRERDPSGEPHLGLGLYVVRLVAQFHSGRVFAEELPGGRVRVGLELPAA